MIPLWRAIRPLQNLAARCLLPRRLKLTAERLYVRPLLISIYRQHKMRTASRAELLYYDLSYACVLVTFSPLAFVMLLVTVRVFPSSATMIVPSPTSLPSFLLTMSILCSPFRLNERSSACASPLIG